MSRTTSLLCLALAAWLSGSTASALPLLERLDARAFAGNRERLPEGTQVLRDVIYAPEPGQVLDIYVPPRRAGDTAGFPVLVMVHGGGWFVGDKQSPTIVGAKATRWLPRGIAVVSVNYRLLPDHDVRTQADDVARALAFVQAKAPKFGGDADRVVLMGHSAGAHLVALVSADPARWSTRGVRPWLGTVVLDGVALDVETVMAKRHMRLLDDVFGTDPAYWRATSPAAALKPGGVPVLAVCSRIRRDNPCAQSHAYADLAKTQGVRVEVLGRELSHDEVNGMLGEPSGYTVAVERFLGSLDAQIAQRLANDAR